MSPSRPAFGFAGVVDTTDVNGHLIPRGTER